MLNAMIQITTLLLCTIAATSYSPHSKVSSQTPMGLSSPIETRRGFLSSASVASTFLLIGPQVAMAEDLVDYEDLECKFSIKIPAGWEQSIQSLPDRRKIVLFFKPDSDQKTFVFLAYTPVRSDYTSLGSFGSVDEVRCSQIMLPIFLSQFC